MYELATLAEMDTAFKRARYYGFKGIGCVLSESKYAYIEITEEQAKEGGEKNQRASERGYRENGSCRRTSRDPYLHAGAFF